MHCQDRDRVYKSRAWLLCELSLYGVQEEEEEVGPRGPLWAVLYFDGQLELYNHFCTMLCPFPQCEINA